MRMSHWILDCVKGRLSLIAQEGFSAGNMIFKDLKSVVHFGSKDIFFNTLRETRDKSSAGLNVQS